MHFNRSFYLRVSRSFGAARLMIVAGLALAIFSAIGLVRSASAEPPVNLPVSPQSLARVEPAGALAGPVEGQQIFSAKCAGCHSIGGGKLVGPDLKDVTKRREKDWIKAFIADPAKMIATDPVAKQLLQENNNLTMPTLGLTPQEIDALVDYLDNPSAAPAAAPIAPGAAAGAGDPVAGRLLFTGEMPLANGGTACNACHTVRGADPFGGGLGPDLTHVIQRLGEPGVSAALTTIAFPTMLGPFQNKPLTPKEQADLVAFLKSSDQWQPPVTMITPGALNLSATLVFGIGLLGALVLFGVLFYIWNRMRPRQLEQLPVRKAGAFRPEAHD